MKCISKDCTKEGTVEIESEPLCPECALLVKKLTAIIERESMGSVRYSLSAIKGVGKGLAETIANERKANGPFRSIGDFAGRIPAKSMNKKSMTAMAKAGVFDVLEPNRATVVDNIEQIIAVAKRTQEDEGTPDMFG